MISTNEYLGKPTNRVDGRAKVTGEAKYAAEHNVPNLAYGVIVSGGIAKGRIAMIDTTEAEAVEGVLKVFTHENAPSTALLDRSHRDQIAPDGGSPFRPLYNDKILFSGQPIALVVAEEFEIARYAASLVKVEYDAEASETNLHKHQDRAHDPKTQRSGYLPPPKPRGDSGKAFAAAPHKIEVEYHQPVEHHNPMENFASTVHYGEEGKLTIYEKTQGVQNCQEYVCSVFSLPKDKVRVLSPFMGGGFGSGLRPTYQLYLAVMAATDLKHSVRVSLTRQQMFYFTHRPEAIQRLSLSASADGLLDSLEQEAVEETSYFEEYLETVVNWSGMLYRCDNVTLRHKLVELDVHTPADMRAPGAVTGIFALESAMDELSYAVGIDPLEFRLKNYSEKDYNQDKPFSSKELRAAYKQGAEKFGWSKRPLAPRSMQEGHELVGWGVATGAWEASQGKASVKAVLDSDGKLTLSSATSDIGTGTYTVMTMIAAESAGLPLENVTFKLGDSQMPYSPVEGGSWTVSSVGSAVMRVCEELKSKLFKSARKAKDSPLADARFEDVTFANGEIKVTANPIKSMSYVEAMKADGVNELEVNTTELPQLIKQTKFSPYSHVATFVEVRVDEDLGTVRCTRVVSAVAGGRILNPKAARSQIMGAVVWGISMALEEESVMDHHVGRFMNHNYAEYHIPVNADIHDIDVIFVEEHDDVVNPLGAKGLGEIGLVGVAAAVANAVYHATGKRVRDLPITLDKLL